MPYILPFAISALLCKILTHPPKLNLHYFINMFINGLYSSHDFLHGQLARITDEEEIDLNDSYGEFLTNMLLYTGRIQERILESGEEKLYRMLNSKVIAILDNDIKVNQIYLQMMLIQFSALQLNLISRGNK